MHCNNCGWENPDTNKNCEKCGSPLSSGANSHSDHLGMTNNEIDADNDALANIAEDFSSASASIPGPLSKNDKFFGVLKPDKEDVSWQRQWEENFEGYSSKYFRAAKLLYEAAKSDSSLLDEVTYPIMYLARHSIELTLKSLVYKLGNKKICKGHDLINLWHELDCLYIGDKHNERYAVAKQLIQELGNYDIQSDTFRYHLHKDKSRTAKSDFIKIELFYSTYLKLFNFLEGLEYEIDTAHEEMSNP